MFDYKSLPAVPGVYLMKDAAGRLLYVGKAANLRRRVGSYFERSHDARVDFLVGRIKKVDYKKTDSALEALILEAQLIKKYQPPFNVREKDDKSFLYAEITKEKFPRVILARGRNVNCHKSEVMGRYGPFTSASNLREALKILRKIFPWSTHIDNANDVNNMRMTRKEKNSRRSHCVSRRRPCFDYEIGLCPGTCVGAISRKDYLKNIRNLRLFFEGKKGRVLKNLEKEMAAASKRLEFEKAAKLRRRIFALRHIRDVALIKDESRESRVIGQESYRIEGYDISNISGDAAVGSMVVFTGGEPDKNEYRKFKIRTVVDANDIAMLKEVLRRRFGNDWPLPDLILVDGGRGQVNAARSALAERGLKISVVGIAKGPERKKNDFISSASAYRMRPPELSEANFKKLLVCVRDEAHRFAIGYHKKLRARNFLLFLK